MDHNSRHELNPKLLAGSSLKFETYQSGVTAYIRDFNPLTSVIARALRPSSQQSVESRWWTSRATKLHILYSKHFCMRFWNMSIFLFLVEEKWNNFMRWTMIMEEYFYQFYPTNNERQSIIIERSPLSPFEEISFVKRWNKLKNIMGKVITTLFIEVPP